MTSDQQTRDGVANSLEVFLRSAHDQIMRSLGQTPDNEVRLPPIMLVSFHQHPQPGLVVLSTLGVHNPDGSYDPLNEQRAELLALALEFYSGLAHREEEPPQPFALR